MLKKLILKMSKTHKDIYFFIEGLHKLMIKINISNCDMSIHIRLILIMHFIKVLIVLTNNLSKNN